jgi:hypothetical protein
VPALLAVLSCVLAAERPHTSHPQTTEARVHSSAWWPTSGAPPRKDYAGADACARCHAKEFAAQQQTSMAHAALRPPLATLARADAALRYTQGSFTTTIHPDAHGDTYSVSRGGERLEAPILYSFGEGVLGQTFLLEHDGTFFESQLTYYPSIRGLDVTPGHSAGPPVDLESAFGAAQSAEAATQCFNCHTTAATARWQLDAKHLTPGVSCEACHGPGARHVAAMERKDEEAGLQAILNPAGLQPVDLVDFCGACHRAPLDVVKEKLVAPIDVRFQPYRLTKSRCWSKPDARIACLACHDPHQPLERNPAVYDSKCLACHRTQTDAAPRSDTAARVCPVRSDRCTSCHMPRYQVAQMHGSFTDHYIRIVRPGDPFPM